MGQLQGLKGIDNNRNVDCLFIKTGKDIEVILNNAYAATAANSNGAINVYNDDYGAIRCEAMRNFATLDEQSFDDMKLAIAWTNKWLRKIK